MSARRTLAFPDPSHPTAFPHLPAISISYVVFECAIVHPPCRRRRPLSSRRRGVLRCPSPALRLIAAERPSTAGRRNHPTNYGRTLSPFSKPDSFCRRRQRAFHPPHTHPPPLSRSHLLSRLNLNIGRRRRRSRSSCTPAGRKSSTTASSNQSAWTCTAAPRSYLPLKGAAARACPFHQGAPGEAGEGVSTRYSQLLLL